MKLAVTGASGFIGRNFLLSHSGDYEIDAYYHSSKTFVGFLEKNKIRANAIKCDLSSERQVKNLKRKKYDACLYLAGNTDPQLSFRDPAFDLTSNALSLTNFLNNFQIGKLVYFSSGAVYHGIEGEVNPQTPLFPTLPYAISKLASEYYVKFFREKGGVGSYFIVRFFGAYGPYEPERKITTKLANAFAIKKAEEFEIYGDGKNLIDFMYVSDAVRAVKLALDTGENDVVADLANNQPIAIEELVEKCASLFGVEDFKIKRKGVSHEPIHFHSTDSTFESMGFKPEISLEAGMRLLAQHLKS